MTRSATRHRFEKAVQAANGDTEHARSKIVQSILNRKQDGKPSKRAIVLQWILDRQKEVAENYQAVMSEKWNLDDIWYHLRRTKFMPLGIEIVEDTRRSVKGYVYELCELLGITRAGLGIIAQAYATLYFDGQLHDVAINELDGLKSLGAYVLIIEKEGIVEGLKPFADKYGIALVTSHGFFTENAKDLGVLIKGLTGSIAILTDFDVSGILIGILSGITRIGVDFETLRYFGYDPTDQDSLKNFDEKYTPKEEHLNPLEDIANGYSAPNNGSGLIFPECQKILDQDLEYLKTKRIEINAVKERVGNAKLWEFIMHELLTKLPPPNYNRSIDIPWLADITPSPLSKLNGEIADKVADITSLSVLEYQDKLAKFKGFSDNNDNDSEYEDKLEDIDGFNPDSDLDLYCKNHSLIRVQEYKEKIIEDFSNQIDNDEDLGPILDEIQRFADKLEKKRVDRDDL